MVVERLSAVRAAHPQRSSLSADFDALEGAHPDPEADTEGRSDPSAVTHFDVHDVANRIMRKDNYLVALFNKNVLNLAVPVPAALAQSPAFCYAMGRLGIATTPLDARARRGQVQAQQGAQSGQLTKVIEWNLTSCILGFVFGPDGRVRPGVVHERNKGELVQA